jgi:hypothetical protein
VIIGSILIALALDALWEARQEAELTREHLEALVSEFRSVQDELRRESDGVASSAEGSAGVIALMHSPTDATPELYAALRMQSFDVGLFTARHPVLTTMLSTGELVDLQNDSLIALVGVWQDEIEHLRADSGHLERNREETIRDRVIALGAVSEIESPRFSLSRLLEDGGLETAYWTRQGRAVRLGTDYDRVARLADEVVALIEDEVARLNR